MINKSHLTRRKLMQRTFWSSGYLSAAGTGVGLTGCSTPADLPEPVLLSSSTDRNGQNFIGAYSLNGEKRAHIPVEHRGHGMAVNPVRSNEIVFFSRRPGTKLHALDLSTGELLAQARSAADRHFYGHGCFSSDGTELYTTENDFHNGEGKVVIRDASTLEVSYEFPSYGVGPHEMRMMPDNATLVIANGGVLTHPSKPREALNLDTMKPNLAYVEMATGKLLGRYELPISRLSIRHIDVNETGRVVVTTQYRGETEDRPALIASHNGESSLQVFSQAAYAWSKLNNYCGSVAYAKPSASESPISPHIAAVTSPRGGRIVLFDMAQQENVAEFAALDICGVGFSQKSDCFVATSGTGGIYRIQLSDAGWSIDRTNAQQQMHWDNHLLLV